MNWVDLAIIILFVLNIISGWQSGLIAGAAELISLLVSIFLAVIALPVLAGFLHSIGFSINMSLFFGFGFVLIAVQIGLAIATMPFTKRIKRKFKDTVFGAVNRALGPIPHLIMFFVSTSFILAAFLAFPIFGPMKSSISSSRFGTSLAAPAVRILNPIAADLNKNAKSSPI
ncbi:MAG: CvpA family protein [Actinomycetota bacterium]